MAEARDMHQPVGDRREDEGHGPVPDVLGTWLPGTVAGAISVVLGLVVAFNPTSSLNVVSILLGVLLVVFGLLHVARAVGGAPRNRAGAAIAGIVYLALGVVLIRHLNVTVVLLALLVGLTWIVQGVVGMMAAATQQGTTRAWLVGVGVVSLVAGIVVIAAPIGSVTVLTVLLGIWWIVFGFLEIGGALVLRHELRRSESSSDGPGGGPADVVDWGGQPHRRHRGPVGGAGG